MLNSAERALSNLQSYELEIASFEDTYLWDLYDWDEIDHTSAGCFLT